jgi:phage-related protein
MKPLIWVGSSLKDLRSFPEDVRRTIGYALYLGQSGKKHADAKPLKGFGGAGVLEVVEDFEGNAYRVVYTVSLPDAVYVLHAFQKKAKRGVATPKRDIEIIRARLLRAHDHHQQHGGGRT